MARAVGADHTVLGDSQAEVIAMFTRGRRADTIFDLVGSDRTATLAGAVAATYAEVTIVGVGCGVLPVGHRSLPVRGCGHSNQCCVNTS